MVNFFERLSTRLEGFNEHRLDDGTGISETGATDMRKQMYTLSVYVTEEMKYNALSGDLYLFCSKNRRLMKALYWDRNGFCLWQKR